MAYGMEVTGADGSGTFLIADTSANLVHQSVSHAGTASTVTISGAIDKPQIFVNAKNVSGQNEGIFAVWNAATRTVSFYALTIVFISNSAANSIWTPKAVNYFIVRNAGENPNLGHNYGMQLLTSSGVVALDTRSFGTNSTHYISEVSAGNLNANSYGDQITADQDAYIEMGWSGSTQGTSSIYHFRAAKFNSTNIVAQSRIGISLTILGSAGFISNPWGLPTMLIGKLR